MGVEVEVVGDGVGSAGRGLGFGSDVGIVGGGD